jgi:hypothetical protein
MHKKTISFKKTDGFHSWLGIPQSPKSSGTGLRLMLSDQYLEYFNGAKLKGFKSSFNTLFVVFLSAYRPKYLLTASTRLVTCSFS